jgi:hypothetical protein
MIAWELRRVLVSHTLPDDRWWIAGAGVLSPCRLAEQFLKDTALRMSFE